MSRMNFEKAGLKKGEAFWPVLLPSKQECSVRMVRTLKLRKQDKDYQYAGREGAAIQE
jgi:hypothetical protein